MALKSSREGLRKELVDYLGNIIIDEKLKQNIINAIDGEFASNEELITSVNGLDEKISNESSARESADSNLQNNINLETTARQEAISNIEDLINQGIVKTDLLWTNANPTGSFNHQTIRLDLSNYKLLLIIINEHVTVNKLFSYIIPIIDKEYILSANSVSFQYRKITSISTSQITFGDGNIINSYNGSEVIENNRAYPIEIYGIK